MITKFPVSHSPARPSGFVRSVPISIFHHVLRYWRSRRSHMSLDRVPNHLLKDILPENEMRIREENRRLTYSDFESRF